MHRIDTPGSVGGLFTAGNPQFGQRATVVGFEWLNDVQENLCDLIEYAGEPLVKGDKTNLRDSILALIAGVVGTGGGLIQWGTYASSLVGDASAAVTLPTSFLNTNYAVSITAINQAANIYSDVWAQRVSKSVGSFTAYIQQEQDGPGAQGLEWIAIGRYA